MVTMSSGNGNKTENAYVTLSGLALQIRLDWPYHKSTSGADFWTLHSEIQPIGTEKYALVAINMTTTLREVLPSLLPKDTEGPTLNALRKEFDRHQIEFLKSAKLVPLPFSSRHYNFKRGVWTFHKAAEEQIAEFLLRRVYWQTKLSGPAPVQVTNAVDAQYLGATTEHLLDAAKKISSQGVFTLEGDYARATENLMSHGAAFEAAQQHALDEMEKKHAFERG
jgi:hypothetical protein